MKQTDTKRNILTVREVCQLLRIGKAEVYRLVHGGRLPVMRFGRDGKTWRFVETDVMNLREGGNS